MVTGTAILQYDEFRLARNWLTTETLYLLYSVLLHLASPTPDTPSRHAQVPASNLGLNESMIRVTCVELLTYLYPGIAPSAIHNVLSLLHIMTCLPSGRIHLIPAATVPIRLQTNLVFSPGYAPAMQWIAAFASPTKWFCLLNAKDNTKWCMSICVCKYMHTYINIYSETPLHRTLRKPKCPQNQICFGPKSYTAWTTKFNPWNKN